MEIFKDFKKKHNKMIKDKIINDYHPDIKIKNKEFEFKVYRQKYDEYNNKVKAEKIINGRTTYWVPKLQI